MLFYGPPGGGKTSGIKAMFKLLSSKGVTCVYVSDASFDQLSVEDVFGFINKYLAPALVVFEDIDLIAPYRRDGASRLIGPLLSALNGIEEQKKPIVIVATTNRVEVLDSAVTRPCRFDRRILVDYPSESDLHKIFLTKAGFDAPEGCFKSSGEVKLTGAHVEEIYRTSALLAEEGHKPVKDCVKEAVEIVKKHFMIVAPKTIGFGDDKPGHLIREQPEFLGYKLAVPSMPGKSDPFSK
jgi:cell division protease FtsH